MRKVVGCTKRNADNPVRDKAERRSRRTRLSALRLSGHALSSAGSSLLDQFAVARNRTVEVRFYKRREDPGQPVDANTNPERFRSFRTAIHEEPVRVATGNFVTMTPSLPCPPVISNTPPPTAGSRRACVRSIDSIVRKDTRGGTPFYTTIFADSTGRLTSRAWSDAPAFDFCEHGMAG